jgi:hypothetical protein
LLQWWPRARLECPIVPYRLVGERAAQALLVQSICVWSELCLDERLPVANEEE